MHLKYPDMKNKIQPSAKVSMWKSALYVHALKEKKNKPAYKVSQQRSLNYFNVQCLFQG